MSDYNFISVKNCQRYHGVLSADMLEYKLTRIHDISLIYITTYIPKPYAQKNIHSQSITKCMKIEIQRFYAYLTCFSW